jgi:hypothetical protein
VLTRRWSRRQSVEGHLDLLRTHSDHRALGATALEAFLAEVAAVLAGAGGEVVTHHETTLLLTRARRPG